MSRRYLVFAVLTTVVIAALAYFYGGSSAPAGQAALQSLTPETLPTLKASFNTAKDSTRVLLLLSPT